MIKQKLLEDPEVWAAVIAAKFAHEVGLPAGNYWEPGIARSLAKAVREGRNSRDQIELLMALQLGIAKWRDGQLHYQNEVYDAV